MKEEEGISQRTDTHDPQTQQCGDGQRKGGGGWVDLGKAGGWGLGTSVIVSTIKIKNKSILKIKDRSFIGSSIKRKKENNTIFLFVSRGNLEIIRAKCRDICVILLFLFKL